MVRPVRVSTVDGENHEVVTPVEARNRASPRRVRSHMPPHESYTGKSRTLGTFGPSGLLRGWADFIHQYAIKDADHGALIGRIALTSMRLIGESKDCAVPVAEAEPKRVRADLQLAAK
jgi:hypothetical protein